MLIDSKKVCIVVFNMQLEILPLLVEGAKLLHDSIWLTDIAKNLNLPLIAIEHKKLGTLAESFSEMLADYPRYEKFFFDCTAHSNIKEALLNTGSSQFVLAGAETHVCLLQSALGIKTLGKEVFILSDTCSARKLKDHNAGINRLQQLGIPLITQEMLFFEIIRNSEIDGYQKIALKFLDGRYIR